MEQERRRVLEMLAEGTIDSEQANQLLDVLSEAGAMSGTTGWHEHPHPHPRRRDREVGNPQLKKLAEARLHGVTPEYVQSLRELGYTDVSLDELVEARIHGVTAEYIGEMRSQHGDLTLVELCQLRVSGITPDYVRKMKAMGFGTASAPAEDGDRSRVDTAASER